MSDKPHEVPTMPPMSGGEGGVLGKLGFGGRRRRRGSRKGSKKGGKRSRRRSRKH
jgi:hypothetical protein